VSSSASPIAPDASTVAELLRARGQSVAVSESSTGGLISAGLLAVPGASDYFLGGGVVYTMVANQALLGDVIARPAGMRGASPEFAAFMAEAIARKLGTTWGLAETGATGPSGNRYGDPAGHSCLAVWGPVPKAQTLRTGSDDRVANMTAFSAAAVALLASALRESG